MSDEDNRDDDVRRESEAGRTSGRLPPRAVLDLDHVYEALSHPRPRYLCYTLLEDAEWSLTDPATKIAAWENDLPGGAVTEYRREQVYASLYHAHVPKLADQGIVTFDDATETISAAGNAEQVLSALRGIGTVPDADQEEHARGEMDDGPHWPER